ncbi:MAG: HigA family addiction module antidote protein [Rhodospirillales bacterium]|jgi:HTH-type transcriptional regulator / antitoxin HigA|nr:HigA family addiction module antidote protein [Rhodospirillales bacterium]
MAGNSSRPDYFFHPGAYLEETLRGLGMKKRDFADRCGRPAKTISEILSGDAAVTPETAIQFERVLGIPASTWTAMEANYRLMLAEKQDEINLIDAEAWAKDFPYRELVRIGVVEKKETWANAAKQLLKFFGVASIDGWENYCRDLQIASSFRKGHTHEPKIQSKVAWLRLGEIKGRSIDCASFNPKLFRETLNRLKSLTFKSRRSEFEDELVSECAKCGVAVVIVKELEGTRMSGAARWLSPEKALVQVSTRYRRDDQFWFSFFHEAGHILLHGKKQRFADEMATSGPPIFVDEEGGEPSIEEKEANEFAQNILLPKQVLEEFYARYPGPKGRFTKKNVLEFSGYAGVCPGVIVGQLQRRHPNLYKSAQLNPLKKIIAE